MFFTVDFSNLDAAMDEVFGVYNYRYEKKDKYVIPISLPGVDKEDIDITVDPLNASVAVCYEFKKDDSMGRIGTFRKSFCVEKGNLDKISTSYKRGIVTIEIPYAEDKKERKIKID